MRIFFLLEYLILSLSLIKIVSNLKIQHLVTLFSMIYSVRFGLGKKKVRKFKIICFVLWVKKKKQKGLVSWWIRWAEFQTHCTRKRLFNKGQKTRIAETIFVLFIFEVNHLLPIPMYEKLT